MVTLKHIAEVAETTVATVSRALRGANDISTERKEEIVEIARRLGYERNPYVSALMKHIRHGRKGHPSKASVAFLITHASRDARSRSVFIDRRFRGMEARVAECGYQSTTFWYNDPELRPARLNKILRARGIRGIVLMLFSQENIGNIEIDWESFAVATQSNFAVGPLVHRVTEDYFENTVTAMEHLWARGCRRIGLAYKASHVPSARFRITSAYARFLELQGDLTRINGGGAGGCSEILIPPIAQWNEQVFIAWFRRERPDAILTFDWGDIPGWLEREGVRIPDDVSLAVLNHCPTAPQFSGIDPEPERLGSTSVDLVVDQLERNHIGLPKSARVLTIAGRWVDGVTTMRPTAVS